jgi:hypothetical protein
LVETISGLTETVCLRQNNPVFLLCFLFKTKKMKQFALISLICIGLQAAAQITITNLTFPAVGDSLRYQTDPNPPLLLLGTTGGGNQFWDFSALQGGSIQTSSYAEAASGAGFPSFQNANLRTGNQLQENYLRKTASVIESLGTSGADQLNLGLNNTIHYQPPLPIRRAPMQFFDIHNFETDLNYVLPISDVADSLLGSLSGLFDSIRIRTHTSRLDIVDAWGMCKIPGGAFEVLREKRTEISETFIDIHSFLGWTDLTGLLGSGNGLLEAIGKDTTITLHFINHLEKEDIAVLTLNNAGNTVTTARFKYIPATSSTTFLDAPAQAVCFPNPTSNYTEIQWNGLESDDYQVTIHDFSGKPFFPTIARVQPNGNLLVDLSGAPAGLLTIQIFDKNHNLVAGSKLIKQ